MNEYVAECAMNIERTLNGMRFHLSELRDVHISEGRGSIEGDEIGSSCCRKQERGDHGFTDSWVTLFAGY